MELGFKKMCGRLLAVLCVLCVCASFSSCKDDDDERGIPDGFCGTYCYNYDNRKFIYYTFNEDGTGEYEFDGNADTYGYFTYTVNGSVVTATGWKTTTDGGGMDFTITFKYTNGTLVSGENVYEKI